MSGDAKRRKPRWRWFGALYAHVLPGEAIIDAQAVAQLSPTNCREFAEWLLAAAKWIEAQEKEGAR
jgi:hypothetical protein